MRPTAPSVDELKENILKTIRDTDWYPHLRLFLNGNEFEAIVEELLKDYELGYRLTPMLKNVFSAYVNCPFASTRVVFHTSQLNPYLHRADGMAFSQSIKGKADSTLRFVFKEIEDTIDAAYKGKVDLTRWAKQGVLLTTSALTTILDTQNAHVELWKPWANYLFDVFKHDLPPDTLYILVGEDVWFRERDVNGIVIKTPLPTWRMPQGWDSDVFNRTNQELKKQNKTEIIW